MLLSFILSVSYSPVDFHSVPVFEPVKGNSLFISRKIERDVVTGFVFCQRDVTMNTHTYEYINIT